MANLIPVAQNDDIYQLEKGNLIIGSRLGMSNKQAQQLLNRMTYIKETLENSISSSYNYFDDEIEYLDDKEQGLKDRMDDIEERSDVVDVVASYSDIVNYDTSLLHTNDIVKCLGDSNHAGIATYYRWTGVVFTFIGYEHKSIPIMITESQTVTPIRAVVYVLSGSNISLTLGNGSYTGISVTIGSISSGINHIITSTDDFVLEDSPEWIRFIWNGSRWCTDVPYTSIDDTYPIGTVIISAVNTSPSTYGTWTQISTGSILITAGQSYNSDTIYGSDSVSYTVTGAVGSTTLTAAQCPSHYHTANNTAVNITTAAGDAGAHTHTCSAPDGDGTTNPSSGMTGYACIHGSTISVQTSGHTHTPTSGSVQSIGSGGAHNHTFAGESVSISVVQPYINLYVFKRTA